MTSSQIAPTDNFIAISSPVSGAHVTCVLCLKEKKFMMEALGCAAFALLTLVSSNNAQFPLQSTQLSILQVSQSNLRLESFMDALSPAQCRKCSLLNLAQIVQPDVIKYSEGLMCDLLL